MANHLILPLDATPSPPSSSMPHLPLPPPRCHTFPSLPLNATPSPPSPSMPHLPLTLTAANEPPPSSISSFCPSLLYFLFLPLPPPPKMAVYLYLPHASSICVCSECRQYLDLLQWAHQRPQLLRGRDEWCILPIN